MTKDYGDLKKQEGPTADGDIEITNTGGQIVSGAYILEEFMLGKITGNSVNGAAFHEVVDLSTRFSSFSVSQSIAEPFMSLTVGMTDAVNILERLGQNGLQGEEFVKLKFYNPGRQNNKREYVDLLFHVVSITPVSTDNSNSRNFYNLLCHTKEKIVCDLSVINKHFSGTAADAAQSVWENNLLGHEKYKFLKTTKGIQWDDREFFNSASDGVDDFIVPGFQVHNAMGWLAAKAYGGTQYPASAYCFFENNWGFHFCNIETYIAINKGLGVNFTYTPTETTMEKLSPSHYRNIQEIGGMQITSTTKRMNDGTFSHNVRSFDLISQTHTDKQFRMDEKFDTFTKPGNIFNTDQTFFDEFGKPAEFEYLVTEDTSGSVVGTKLVGVRDAYMNLLNTYRLKIVVYGDTALNVGDVITISLPEVGTARDRDLSIYSGSWFVQSLTHVCDVKKHNTVLGLSKAGLEFEQSKV